MLAASHRLARKLPNRLTRASCEAMALCLLRTKFSTLIDDLNGDMEEMFGLPSGSCRTGTGTLNTPATASAPAAAVSHTCREQQAAQQAAAINAELFEFFGVPQHMLPPAAPAASTQCRHVVASAAQRPAAPREQRQDAEQHSAGTAVLQSLTHVDTSGRATMVDVSEKRATFRTASAGCRVLLGPEVYALVESNQLAKGDVLTVAQLAGVMGAKHTSTLIPLCHNILLSKVSVELALEPSAQAVDVTSSASTIGPTGVEMEALTAAAVAALTVYDMCKAASKAVAITDLRLLSKEGGKSGGYRSPGI